MKNHELCDNLHSLNTKTVIKDEIKRNGSEKSSNIVFSKLNNIAQLS